MVRSPDGQMTRCPDGQMIKCLYDQMTKCPYGQYRENLKSKYVCTSLQICAHKDYHQTKRFLWFFLILLLCNRMLKVFHSQKCPIFDWIDLFYLFMFSEDFEALIYDFDGILIILTPNLSFIKACPLFYKQNIQRFGSFKDRPIFRCYFLLWICKKSKKSKEKKDFQKSYSNQLLKFVFSILAAK